MNLALLKKIALSSYCKFLEKNSTFNKKDVERILIFAHMGLGNFILLLPTIKSFKKRFPKAYISLATGQKALVELAFSSGIIDEHLFISSVATFSEKLKFLMTIRKRKYDIVIKNFNGFFYTTIGLSGIPCRIGHVSSVGWPIPQDYVFNYKAVMEKNEHEIQRNCRLFYTIESKKINIEEPFSFSIPKKTQEYVVQIIRHNNIKEEDIVLGIQVGTTINSTWKEWRVDNMAKLADKLIENYKAKVIFVGGNEEIEKTRYVESKMSNLSLNLVGKTSILQAAALLKQCDFFISNDTGLAHLSRAVNIPTITIYGPSDYKRTGPWKKNDIIIRKNLSCSPCYKTIYDISIPQKCNHKNCLNSITVKEVFNKIEEKLNNFRK